MFHFKCIAKIVLLEPRFWAIRAVGVAFFFGFCALPFWEVAADGVIAVFNLGVRPWIKVLVRIIGFLA